MPALDPAQSPLAPAKPNVEGIIAQQPKRLEELNKDVSDTDKQVSDINKKEGAMKMPELQPVPQPTVQPTDPAKIWGSAAMLFAGLGGLMTRRPIVTAMNAATKVFDAYRQGDQEAAKVAFDSWKAANENAMKIADFQQKQYKEAMDGYEKDKTGALAALRAKMVAFQDETGVQQLDVHGIQGAEQHMIELKRLQQEWDKAQPGLEKGNDQHQAAMSIKAAQKEYQAAQASKDPAKMQAATEKLKTAVQEAQDLNSAYGGKGGSGSANPLSDEDLKSMSEQYLAGDKSVLSGLGFGNAGAANRARLQDMIRKTAKDLGMSGGDIAAKIAEFQGVTAGERTLSTTAARIGLGAAEMQTLVPQVKEASKKLSRGDASLTMNGLIQRAEHETQNPQLRSLAVRLQGLKSAYSQVLTRGGVPTDSARAATDELFSTKDSQTVLDTVLDAMGQETAAIRAAPGIVREELREGISGNTRSGAMPTVNTQAEYDSLPSGSRYKEADGKTYKKP